MGAVDLAHHYVVKQFKDANLSDQKILPIRYSVGLRGD